jgi:predicted RNA-binding protein with RPS1 domain
VVSRKAVVEEDSTSRKSSVLESIVEGAVVTGTVKTLTEYGAFIDLGGIDGLLHVSDMSFGRVNHPSEMLAAGDQISVKVLKFDREKERISLGLKQLNPDPWESIFERYPAGARVIGRIVSITDYGAFVELELEPPDEASFEGGQGGRPGGGCRARSQAARAPHLTRHQTTRGRSLDHGQRTLQRRLRGGRPHPQTL